MTIFEDKSKLSQYLLTLQNDVESLGFVPTMGALHQGHLSLIECSVAENDHSVVSIFVNPTQFDNTHDLNHYPKDLQTDIDLIQQISSDIIIYTPSVTDVYDEHISPNKYDFDSLDTYMEGVYRKGHFEGVATVVDFFFNLIKPQRVYFGEKDYQQLMIIKRLFPNINIIACPICREENGLAMSSRNRKLDDALLRNTGIIYQTLLKAQESYPEQDLLSIRKQVNSAFETLQNIRLEYFEIADEQTLKPIKTNHSEKPLRMFISVYFGDVRLIDNLSLTK